MGYGQQAARLFVDAPLLVGAYAFVVLMLFGYLVMVSRRLGAIKTEVDRLDADLKRTGKG